MNIKNIIKSTLTALIAAAALSSCNVSEEESVEKTTKPDPVEILQNQAHSEKQLRIQTEMAMTDEVKMRKRWELASGALCVIGIIAFVAGTSIGSKANRHASVSSR